jgi:phage major head subunit gpT-like protein
MAIVNAATLVAMQQSFRALFRATAEKVEPMWQKMAMEAPSEAALENYQWLGRVPAMKEWVDSKTLEQLRGGGYTIINKDWESTIEVDRNDIEDDRLGMYRPRIAELADEGMRHPDELLSTARRTGSATLCYDGQFFYDTDHSEGMSGVLSNRLTGTGTTTAQITVDFFAALAAMRNFKDDQGKPYIRRAGPLDLLAVIPPLLERPFRELANATMISNTTNVLAGTFQYMVDPYLTDVNDWFLDYVGAPMKPYVVQMRKKPTFVALEDPNSSESVFMRKKFAYSVEARYNVGYGLWQYSVQTAN